MAAPPKRTDGEPPAAPGKAAGRSGDTPPASADSGEEGHTGRPEAARRPVQERRNRILLAVGGVVVAGVLAWLVFGVGITHLVEKILNLPGWLVVGLVFLLPALEASAFVGVLFPGEIAVLLGGVVASQGTTSLAAVLVAASVGAVAGDQVGYLVGREWGEQVLRKIPDALLDDARLANGQAFVRRMGAKGVIIGRWTAALRALVPGLAGMSHLPYPRFLVANVIGGVLWAVTVGVIGYVAGDNWKRVQSTVGSASYLLLGLLIVGGVGLHLVRRRRYRNRS